MITERSRYDPDLHMFAEQSQPPDLPRLRFLRWLAEHGKLEHQAAGLSTGDYAGDPSPEPPAAA